MFLQSLALSFVFVSTCSPDNVSAQSASGATVQSHFGYNHRWARGGNMGNNHPPPPPPRASKKVLPPRPTTYLLLFPPPTCWSPEAAEKITIFVQNCQNFAFFWQLSRKFSGFFFYSSPFPPQKGGTCPPPPPRVQKPLPPPGRILADPPPSCRPHAHL